MLDPVPLPDFERVQSNFHGELVHEPLDGEGRLGAPGAAVGVGGHLGGEHPAAAERVGVHLVDGGEHEGAEDRDTGGDQHQVGAHVGEQVDLQAADPAVGVSGEPQLLPLVPAVVHGHVALAAGLGPLDRPPELAGDQDGQHLFGRHLQLRAEPAADVRRDNPQVLLRDPRHQGQHDAENVRDLGRGPQRELAAHARADHRARLHRRRDQPLLAVGALQDDRSVMERGVHVALAEQKVVAQVARLVHLGRAVLQRRPHVEHRRQRLVVDLDGVQRVRGRVTVPGHDAGHGLTDVAHLIGGHRRVRRDHDVRRDRPGAGQAALLVGEVRAGVGGDDSRLVPGRADVHGRDPGVRERAAQERHVQHPGQPDVVGPVGLAGNEALVFLPEAGPPELCRRGARRRVLCPSRACRVSLRAHWLTPAWAARRTARTMFS